MAHIIWAEFKLPPINLWVMPKLAIKTPQTQSHKRTFNAIPNNFNALLKSRCKNV